MCFVQLFLCFLLVNKSTHRTATFIRHYFIGQKISRIEICIYICRNINCSGSVYTGSYQYELGFKCDNKQNCYAVRTVCKKRDVCNYTLFFQLFTFKHPEHVYNIDCM